MPVPESVRKVPRPKNTVVEDSGRDGPKRYSVRERSITKYVPGKYPQPHNGKVVGHIIDLRFVPVIPKESASASAVPDMLSYGSSALVRSEADDLMEDLLLVYDPSEVFAIMSIATLKVIKPSITAGRMSTHYRRTFVSIDYPGAALSKNSVGSLYQRLGRDGQRRLLFYRNRVDRVSAQHHIAIDGTLKQDTSRVNDLSAFSYKARVRGCCEVSVLYAYDIEKMEPICAEVFPGNSIDASSYRAFIRDNDIRKGIIVADKGFPPSRIGDELKERPELHFLTPIKRNDARIADNNMLSFEGLLKNRADHVLYKKQQIKGGRFLYAFKNMRLAAAEDRTYLESARKESVEYQQETYDKKKAVFGLIVLESDQDLPAETAYTCYDDRWLLELVFKHYKSDECLDLTNVQGDFSVIGAEFVNFISTVLTCRIIKKAEQCGVLEDSSYSELMEDLSSAWRKTDAPRQLPQSDDDYWVHTLKGVKEELEKLGLSQPTPKPEPKRRGRKPKPRSEEELNRPRRPRGRPRKAPASS